MNLPEVWAQEDIEAARAATDKKTEQQILIFLAVARVLKKWTGPISRTDYDAGMEAARKCS